MALKEERENDLLGGLHHRLVEKSTSMQNASALYQIHRKELKSYLKLMC